MSAQVQPVKPLIHWLEVDYTPAFFLAGPMKNQGFAQVAKRDFIERLPEFRHVTLNLNLKRLKKICRAPKKYIA